MDLELKWRDLTWFEVLGRATATHEEALETAIPEYCPDMNRIVDATGQLQIRDREITGGAVMLVLALLFFDRDAMFPATQRYRALAKEHEAELEEKKAEREKRPPQQSGENDEAEGRNSGQDNG